jgi:hypothetical protein
VNSLRFQMWEQFRQDLMAEHRFYVEQAHKRLLSQFENIETEANKATEEHLEKVSIHFNADKHDPSRFNEAAHEAAHEKGIEFYQLLSDMHEATRLSVIAGMFHQWDKKLRGWIVGELRHDHHGKNAAKEIWSVDFLKMIDFLATCGFDVKALPCHNQLDAMRLVVNVFKHGNGQSLDNLKKSYPKFISYPLGFDDAPEMFRQYLDHADLKLTDVHVMQFSEAILDFWGALPGEISLPTKANVPNWLLKALQKDWAEA